MIDKEVTKSILDDIKSVTGEFNLDNPISLHEPIFTDTKVMDYLRICIDSGWVSSSGRYVEDFEKSICKYTGAKYAIAVNNGTVALRLLLFSAGVKSGDEVLIPPLSFVATANAVSHLNAFPHFVDIDPLTLGICPKALSKRLDQIAIRKKDGNLYNKETGRKISAIMPVHVFGNPALIHEIFLIANEWGIPLLEDAAEALGSWIKKDENFIHCGLFGKGGILSFNGNKIISTGGGGALITNNSDLAIKAKHLSSTAKLIHPWKYEHDQIGWNDRMPNINAALGLAQMEVLNKRIAYKEKLSKKYESALKKNKYVDFLKTSKDTISNNWLSTIKFKSNNKNFILDQSYDLLKNASENGLFIRPAWQLLHTQKMYLNHPKGILKNAESESYKIINLPSSPQLLENF